MGVPVLVLGETGSGKTYSIKNFDVDEVGIFSVEKKTLSEPQLKKYVIDDSQYLLVNEMFDRAKDTGYGKFTDMALNFRNLIHFINKEMPDDVVVYFLHHTEMDSDSGKIKAKTIGKMLDQQLTVEGCFDIVLLASVEGQEHYFITQSDGYTTAKSPEGMFELKIPNDLKAVDEAIRDYWGLRGEAEDGQ